MEPDIDFDVFLRREKYRRLNPLTWDGGHDRRQLCYLRFVPYPKSKHARDGHGAEIAFGVSQTSPMVPARIFARVSRFAVPIDELLTTDQVEQLMRRYEALGHVPAHYDLAPPMRAVDLSTVYSHGGRLLTEIRGFLRELDHAVQAASVAETSSLQSVEPGHPLESR